MKKDYSRILPPEADRREYKNSLFLFRTENLYFSTKKEELPGERSTLR